MSDGQVMIRLHAPLVESKGPWLGSDVGPPLASWNVDPATALAWALCVDAGVTVDSDRFRGRRRGRARVRGPGAPEPRT